MCLVRASHEVTYLGGACGKSQDRTRHPKSILDSAGYGRSASNDPSLTGPLEPQRVVGGRRVLAEEGLHPPGYFCRCRFQVVDEGCGERLPRFVVAELLEWGSSQTLCRAPDKLPLDKRWVDRAAVLVGYEIAPDLHPSGPRVYLHLRQVYAVGVGHVVYGEGTAGAETRLFSPGRAALRIAGGRYLLQGYRPVR